MKKGKKKINAILIAIFSIVVILFVLYGMILYLSQFHLDLSQEYRSIDGYDNIVFKDNRNTQCFHLCAWGLVKTKNTDGFADHRNPDQASSEYQLIVEKSNAEHVWQVVPSPDGKYILYVEKKYSGSGITDDEYVYYKVYSVDDGTTVTVYSGYRQYLLVDWK